MVTDELVNIAQEHIIKWVMFSHSSKTLFFPPISNISHMRIWDNVSDYSTVYKSCWEPSMMRTQEYFCGLFYLYNLCVLRVSWSVWHPLRLILKHCGRRRLSKHLWKISKHPNNKRCGDSSPDICLCQDVNPKGRVRYFHPEKCWNVILRSLMHIRTGWAFLCFP